jgi:alkanesulfonate monooxygenase SsuD/methylene tetrahydromethanopterin reductase-like flavin-dependent oxidoreductase (luciferase family)
VPSGTADPLISGKADWSEAEGRAAGAGRLWFTDEGPALALAAGVGRRHDGLRIGVLVDPARRPVTVLAKQLTGLDVLIGGRLDVALPKGDETAEVALVLRTLAQGEKLVHEGPLSRAEGARCLPPSPQAGGFPLFSVAEHGEDWLQVEPLP